MKKGYNCTRRRSYDFFVGSFYVRKWRTNHEKLRQIIEIQEDDAVNTGLGGKVIGIKWDENKDLGWYICSNEESCIEDYGRNLRPLWFYTSPDSYLEAFISNDLRVRYWMG